MGPSTPTSLFSKAKPTAATANADTISIREYLDNQIDQGHIDRDLGSVLMGVAESCSEVSGLLKTHTLDYNNDSDDSAVTTTVNVQGEQQKKMDVVANDVFVQTLKSVNSLVAMASEEEEAVIYTGNDPSSNHDDNDNSSVDKKSFEIAFDPLDGSGNLDVNLPTGSIFGIAETSASDGHRPFSRPGTALVASGYALYSSSTELVISLGKNHPDGVLGFTLVENLIDNGSTNDSSLEPTPSASSSSHTFVLSRKNIRCPAHGPYYSLNEAREPDWPDGLKRWISDSKRGHTTTQKLYSSRYVCSLCADFHRTLLQGGWAGNPRPHLRLLYEAAPLAHVVEAAGGSGSDGTQRLLEILPTTGLHDRVCVFLGSRDDIEDLESYGDIQQVQSKRYEA